MKAIYKLLVLAVALVAASCGSGYKYESVKGDPMNARIYTLDNGLKVYMTVNKEEPRIQTYIAVRVGSKNDPAETTGLAHYFEHLMFKGTRQFGTQDYEAEKPLLDQIEETFELYRKTTDPAQRKAIYRTIDSLSYEASKYAIPNEYDKLMTAIGSTGTNAYTGEDMTVYIEDIPSNQIENWARIQADRFRNVVIRGFHTELETVYEEYNMYAVMDNEKVMEALFEELFPHHPYGRQTVLGSQEHLKNPSITNIKNYHTNWYVPNNMAICLAGDFNPDEMIKVIDKYFGDMTPNPDLPETVKDPEVPITAPIIREVIGNEAEFVVLGWRTPGQADRNNPVLTVLGSVLYNGKAGLIDLDLVQQQKVLGAYSFVHTMADHGMVFLFSIPQEGQTLEEVRDLLLGEIKKLKAGEFDEDLIESIVNNYKARFMRSLDSNRARADLFVNCFINGIDWKDHVNYIDRLSAVTKQEVMAYASDLLADNGYVEIRKLQGKDPNEKNIEKPEITPILTNRDTTSDFLLEIQNSDVKPIEPVFLDFKKDLSVKQWRPGVEILYKQNPTNDLFTLYFVFETGSNNDPVLNTAFNYIDYLGTSEYSAEQLKQEFYKIACNYGFTATPERSYGILSGLGENMEKALELFGKLIFDAKADDAVLENLKNDLLQERINNKHDQSYNFTMLRNYVIYGPEYAAERTLSGDAIKALTSGDLLRKVRDLFSYEHRVMYYGPASESTLETAVDKAGIGTGELSQVPPLKRFMIKPTNRNTVYVAEYDAAQINYVQVASDGKSYDPANDAITTLYNEYFGGGMNAIVFQEMREARGLAYSAYARLSRPAKANDPYYYMAYIATQNDKMSDAIDAFEEIINNMPESQTAFDLAKESILTSIRTERILKQEILWEYLSAMDLGIDYDHRKNIFEAVQSMTLDDVKKFQQEWIKNRAYTFGILGRSKDLDMKKLESFGPVRKLSQEEIFGY